LPAGLDAERYLAGRGAAVLGLAVAADIATACNVAAMASPRPRCALRRFPIPSGPACRSDVLVLSRRFVTAIASVVEDGTTLTQHGFLAGCGLASCTVYPPIIPANGAAAKIVVSYTAGFATVPGDLKGAATDLIQTRLSEQSRDPLLRSLQSISPTLKSGAWITGWIQR
jgi:hypothetical protein